MIKLKRAYDKPDKNDGVRILVDRLWPRGVSKKEAEIDIWLKEIAPSDELRKWFDHEKERWQEFKKRYFNEIEEKISLIHPVIEYIEKDHGVITLVYAAKDEEHNNAIAIKEILQK